MVKLRRMPSPGHVACMGAKINAYTIWVLKKELAIVKTPTKWSAYKIPSVIVVFVVLVCKV
jgi:hypothetical protein